MNDKERVICAAVRTLDQVWYGHRHSHALKAMKDFLSYKMNRKQMDELQVEQGFVTTAGRFVTREEGRKLQDTAGIKSVDREGYRGDTLYSEDLY